MANEMFTKVVLDRPRRIRYSNRAIYRHGTLDRPLPLAALGDEDRGFTALCQWLWACMDEPGTPFATPEDIAEHIPPERVSEIARTLVECIELGIPKKDAKNADSSTQSPSPASS